MSVAVVHLQRDRQLTVERVGDGQHFICTARPDDQAERSENLVSKGPVVEPSGSIRFHNRRRGVPAATLRFHDLSDTRLGGDLVALIAERFRNAVSQHGLRRRLGENGPRGFDQRIACSPFVQDQHARVRAELTGTHRQ